MAAKSLPLITGKDNLLNVKLQLVQRTIRRHQNHLNAISALKSVLYFSMCVCLFLQWREEHSEFPPEWVQVVTFEDACHWLWEVGGVESYTSLWAMYYIVYQFGGYKMCTVRTCLPKELPWFCKQSITSASSMNLVVIEPVMICQTQWREDPFNKFYMCQTVSM